MTCACGGEQPPGVVFGARDAALCRQSQVHRLGGVAAAIAGPYGGPFELLRNRLVGP